jgi:hypothetical protein
MGQASVVRVDAAWPHLTEEPTVSGSLKQDTAGIHRSNAHDFDRLRALTAAASRRILVVGRA